MRVARGVICRWILGRAEKVEAGGGDTDSPVEISYKRTNVCTYALKTVITLPKRHQNNVECAEDV